MTSPYKALIFAGGYGSRMRPLTYHTPKALMPLGGETLLGRAISQLGQAGVEEIHINTHYLADQIERYLSTLSAPPPHLVTTYEPKLRETGGTIAEALEAGRLGKDNPFYTINGDIAWLDNPGAIGVLERMRATFDPTQMDGLLLVHPCHKAIGYEGNGNFSLLPYTPFSDTADNEPIPDIHQLYFPAGEPNQISSRPDAFTSLPYVFTGIALLHPRLFDVPLPPPPFSLSLLFRQSRDPNHVMQRLYGMVHTGEWYHIGTPEGLVEAQRYVVKN